MSPTTDIYIYFYIILSGFLTVWAFRKTIKRTAKLGEFEYIGFSAFWGIALIVLWEGLTKISPPPVDLFSNPFSTGLVLSLVGMACSYLAGSVWLTLIEVHEFGWKKALKNIFSRRK